MLFAIFFNLDQSKILSSGNGLTKDYILCSTKFQEFADDNSYVTDEGLLSLKW